MSETRVRSHKLEPSTLSETESDNLCPENLRGFCSKGDKCERSHAISRIYHSPPPPWASQGVQSIPNFLSLRPRAPRQAVTVFDSDGPGYLCNSGEPRHDNDHVDFRNIRILPTMDEVLSLRAPYMPRKDDHPTHFLPRGQDRLLDTLFRQMRCDNVESIVHVTYHASQILVAAGRASKTPTGQCGKDGNYRVETSRGDRFNMFRNVKFEAHHFHSSLGLIIRVSYDCPHNFRGAKMHRADVLKNGMLVALVGLDSNGIEISTTFFEVHLRESTEAMKSRNRDGTRASIQLAFAQRDDVDDLRRILLYSQGVRQGQFVLVEYPKVLLAGFYHCLKQLQALLHKHTLPFLEHIAPSTDTQVLKVEPPAYARKDGFQFDLSRLKKSQSTQDRRKLLMSGREDLDSQDVLIKLRDHTTLDRGQAQALVENLRRELAFTQGPPGTGKTYLGVALVKAIYASHMGISMNRPKPILAVCMTNHALDSFLSDLKREGILHIARLGSGSRETWTKELQLSELNRRFPRTQIERHTEKKRLVAVEALTTEGEAWCEALNGFASMPWRSVREHLSNHYVKIYDQFAGLDTSEKQKEDLRHARYAGGFAFYCWTEGHDLDALREMTREFSTYLGIDPLGRADATAVEPLGRVQLWLDEIIASARDVSTPLMSSNVWSMSPRERRLLMSKWKEEIGSRSVLEKAAEIHRRHFVAREALMSFRHTTDVRCLVEQQIIGVTTTACAKFWPLLHQVGVQVVICEEAGEVMEAHTMCTMFPSIQHAIFIGDPDQLRPQVAEQALSLETEVGQHFRLDESLFERLSHSRLPKHQSIPTSCLSLQRRMHPDIADISRTILYPYLKDHEDTEAHPPVPGLVHRMWWFDHRQAEDAPDATTKSKSVSNTFEAEMVFNLVQYLINRNEYDIGHIAVLTPYNGQLALLTKRLRSLCSIFLSDKDRAALAGDGYFAKDEDAPGARSDVQMLDMLRVATIDNFQGEEAKVVILSTVRSNKDERVGFLRTINRINVACSRARDGFYIIGNADTMRHVPTWSQIINLLIDKERIGPYLQACCSRHRFQIEQVFEPKGFKSITTCKMACRSKLRCGHVCPEMCHALSLHERQKCRQPCTQVYRPCQHPCLKECGEPCGKCQLPLPPVSQPCGHLMTLLCGQKVPVSSCMQVVEKIKLSCGHALDITCSERDKSHICKEICQAKLECGHECQELCTDCQIKAEHPVCQTICGQDQDCGHKCQMTCHEGHCPECAQPCRIKCPHGPCDKKCYEICDPCVKRCLRACDHHGQCETMCSLPCTTLPCNETCHKVTKSGERCFGICGEKCPKQGTAKQQEEEGTRSGNTVHPGRKEIRLPCGHCFPVETLDRHVELNKVFSLAPSGEPVNFQESVKSIAGQITELPSNSIASAKSRLTCPRCEVPITDVFRYTRFSQLPNLKNVIDRMLAKFGRKLAQKDRTIAEMGAKLLLSFSTLAERIIPNVMASKANQRLIRERGCYFDQIISNMDTFEKMVMIPFFNDLALQSPLPLRFELLIHRCKVLVFRDALRTLSHLRTLSDPSTHLTAMISGLTELLLHKTGRSIATIAATVDTCRQNHHACLEVELLLVGIEMQLISNAVRPTHLHVPVTSAFERISTLGTKYNRTAGEFTGYALELQAFASGYHKVAPEHGKEHHVNYEKWGRHIVGHLKKCENGHLYSGETFKFCPECGPVREKAMEYEKQLAVGEGAIEAVKKRIESLAIYSKAIPSAQASVGKDPASNPYNSKRADRPRPTEQMQRKEVHTGCQSKKAPIDTKSTDTSQSKKEQITTSLHSVQKKKYTLGTAKQAAVLTKPVTGATPRPDVAAPGLTIMPVQDTSHGTTITPQQLWKNWHIEEEVRMRLARKEHEQAMSAYARRQINETVSEPGVEKQAGKEENGVEKDNEKKGPGL